MLKKQNVFSYNMTWLYQWNPDNSDCLCLAAPETVLIDRDSVLIKVVGVLRG